MINNYRYDKLNLLLHLQHQRSHYKRIIQAKKHIQFKKQQKSPTNPHPKNHSRHNNLTELKQKLKQSQNNDNNIQHHKKQKINKTKIQYKFGDNINRRKEDSKFYIQKQRQRVASNNRIVHRIWKINQQKGILQEMFYQSQKKGYQIGSNLNRMQSQNIKISKSNAKFAERLVEVKPMVGTIGEWNTHYKIFKNTQKRLTKSKSNYDPQLYLRQTISSLSQHSKFSHISRSLTRRNKTNIPQASQHNIQKLQFKQQQNPAGGQQKTRRKRRKFHHKKNSMSESRPNTFKQHLEQFQMPKAESECFKLQINRIIRTQHDYQLEQQEEEQLKQYSETNYNTNHERYQIAINSPKLTNYAQQRQSSLTPDLQNINIKI